MASLTVRDVPEAAVSTFRRRASRHHRSLNGEVLSILAYAASFADSFDFPVQPGGVSDGQDPILELAGAWVDSRPMSATISDIENARTCGREIPL